MEVPISLHFNQRGSVQTLQSCCRRALDGALLLFLSMCSSLAWGDIPENVSLKGEKLSLERLSSGHGILWGMAFLPSGDVLLTEKSGRILRWNLKTKKTSEISGVPEVAVHGQGGLLDIALHPDYETDPWVYITYSVEQAGKYTTRLSRLKYQDGSFAETQVLFTAEPDYPTRKHFGSRIALKDGFLFFTVGDRGHRKDSQNLGRHMGKVLRLNYDGTVPANNPFVDQKGAKPEIWSYGHRNPQGLTVHPDTGRLWLHEHGPDGGDEINLVEKGKNYGWPKVTFGHEYYGPPIGKDPPVQGMESPKKNYSPSIAPSGFTIVPKSHKGPLSGAFVLGSLVLTHINVVWPAGDGFQEEIRLLNNAGERIRDVGYYQGSLYFTTDSGLFYRLKPVRDAVKD